MRDSVCNPHCLRAGNYFIDRTSGNGGHPARGSGKSPGIQSFLERFTFV
jgi:hypothetical protein